MEKSKFLQSFLLLLGRICISIIFIIVGFNKIIDFQGNLAYMVAHGIPYTKVLLILSIVCELGGGILILLGWFTRLGAVLLLLFVLLVTFIFHSFWNYDPVQSMSQMQHFLKNISIFGGLLYVLATGAGCFSVDACRKPHHFH